ncbi:hypothetical protein EDD16DRAFT_1725894 [Pisolithus croceorrhizus]|nr:hypothetical protein EDD16DRAFT_1725894 [Pisolithus croceorrhizus]
MDNDLCLRLGRAEDDLLSSILAGKDSLTSWRSEWSALIAELTEASSSGASTVTIAVGDAVVSKVAAIAKCFLEVGRKDEDLSSKLQVDIDEILSSTDSLHLSTSACTSVPQTSKADFFPSERSYVNMDTAPPAFIGPAYRWLLQHIHNPYPPHHVKQSLALTSGCSLNSINSWFTNIRKRIGWTSICRGRFHGCRADSVDAAFRALVQDDPGRPVGDELLRAFVAMKVAAEELYSSTFPESVLATGLGNAVKDTTDCSRQGGNPGIVRGSACDKTYEGSLSSRSLHSTVESADEGNLHVDSRSLTSSPMPSLTDDDSGGDEDILPLSVAGQKRRVMSENQTDTSLGADRPRKRLRVREHSAISLQAPLHDTLEDPKGACYLLHDNPQLAISTSSYCTETTPKRWLPQGDAQRLPKDFFGSNIRPRIHAVSDPLPRSTSDTSDIDEWFNAHFTSLFEFPPPVSTELDQTLPWEVELYHDYSIPLQSDNCLQIPDKSSTSAVGISDTLCDFRVGGVTCESDLLSLADSHLFDPPNRDDVPPLSTSPSGSHSPNSSLPTSSPIIDWAHLFSSNVDVVDTPPLHPQLGDPAMAHLMSCTSYLDDDVFASTSMLLANEQFPLDRTACNFGTDEIRGIV